MNQLPCTYKNDYLLRVQTITGSDINFSLEGGNVPYEDGCGGPSRVFVKIGDSGF